MKKLLLILFTCACVPVVHAQWTSNGPYTNKISIYSLAKYQNDLYAGSAEKDGVFYSGDKGEHWEKRGKGLPKDNVIYSLMASHDTVFAGLESGGIYRSFDKGNTWHADTVGLDVNAYIYTMYKHGNTIYTGTFHGVTRSFDNGATWNFCNNGPQSFMLDIIYYKSRWYATTNVDKAYYTEDNGNTWLESKALGDRLATNGDTLFCMGSTGLQQSTDGINWTTPANNASPNTGYYYKLVCDNKKIYTTSLDVAYRSDDYGQNWININKGLNNDLDELVTFGDTVLVSSGKGIFKSDNEGNNWKKCKGIKGSAAITSLTAINNSVFAGTNKNQVFSSPDKGATWISADSVTNNETVKVTSVVQFNNKLYALADSTSNVYVSPDSGQTWEKGGEILPASNTNMLNYLVVRQNKLYAAGRSGLFVSGNGVNWTKIYFNTTTPTASNYVTDLKLENNILYMSRTTSNIRELYYSVDNDTVWVGRKANITPISTQLRSLYIKNGFIMAGTNKGAFSTIDTGRTWKACNQGLPKSFFINVNAIVSIGDTIFTGLQDSGLYYTTNKGANWMDYNAGLSKQTINCLLVNNGLLYAGTDYNVSLRGIIPILGIGNVDRPANILLYPNPSNGNISLRFDDIKTSIPFTIFNISGQEVKVGTLSSGISNIDISNQPEGLYLLKMNIEGIEKAVKISLIK